MKLRHVQSAVLLLTISVGGCAFPVKNVQPAVPYDFKWLHQVALYAQAAYADNAAIRAICKPTFNDVYIQTIPSTNNKFFLATSTTTRTQLISIAGTANLENALVDADFTQREVPELRISLHRGFARAAHLIYEDIKPRLLPGYRVQLTGHSLGGAEALIIGMLLKTAGTPPESIVTFGQPKVTNPAGAGAFKDLPLTRVVNQDDIVPEMPIGAFRHIGPELVLFPGKAYSVVERRPFDPDELVATWEAFRRREAPAQIPHHYILNYLVNLDSKLTTSQKILYPQ